jgi:hypothetical protein
MHVNKSYFVTYQCLSRQVDAAQMIFSYYLVELCMVYCFLWKMAYGSNRGSALQSPFHLFINKITTPKKIWSLNHNLKVIIITIIFINKL